MKVLVLIADGKTPDSTGDILCIEGLDLKENLVPVTLGFGNYPERNHDHILGMAILTIENDKVYAEIDYFDTEKAKLKQQIPMYPAISGYVTKAEIVDGHKVIKKFTIKSIAFNHERNSDERIQKA